jgi:hypothetical protein
MRSIVLGMTLAVGASLILAVPAQADDTVTTSDVRPGAWSQVVNPYFDNGDAPDENAFPDYDLTTEPLSFPFVTPDVVAPDDNVNVGFDISWSAPAPAAGCTRVVNSYALSISDAVPVEDINGISFGASVDGLQSVVETLAIDPPRDYRGNGADIWVVAPQGRTITVTFAEPVPSSDGVSAILILSADREAPHSFTIDDLTFNVTDTCAAVAVPADPDPDLDPTTPSSSAAPTVAAGPSAPVKPELANTGADFAPMGITAGALLLAGIAAVGAVSATRRIRSTRP